MLAFGSSKVFGRGPLAGVAAITGCKVRLSAGSQWKKPTQVGPCRIAIWLRSLPSSRSRDMELRTIVWPKARKDYRMRAAAGRVGYMAMLLMGLIR